MESEPLPDGWSKHNDATGRLYYFNSTNSQTSWIHPSHVARSNNFHEEQKDAEESNWKCLVDNNTGKEYYYNVTTKETSWSNPMGINQEQNSTDCWIERIDPKTEKSYFYNPNTKETSWINPNQHLIAQAKNDDWITIKDKKTNKPYYYNKTTKEVAWNLPPGAIVHDTTTLDGEIEGNNKDVTENVKLEQDMTTVDGEIDKDVTENAELEQHMDNDTWVECCDASTGKLYYYNKTRRKSAWELPADAKLVNHARNNTEIQNETWKKCKDPSSEKEYYYNTLTMETSWSNPIDPPNEMNPKMDGEWVPHVDPTTQKTYYYNPKTRKTSWQVPTIEILAAQDSLINELNKTNDELKIDLSDDDWKLCKDAETNREYLFNEKRRQSIYGIENAISRNEASDSLDTVPGPVCEALVPSDAYGGAIFQDYAFKQGGGTRFFGRQNWKKRYFVIMEKKVLGVFKSKSDFDQGHAPIKNRWIDLTTYRLEEMLCDDLGFRLLPAENMTTEKRVWNLRATNLNQKHAFIRVLHSVVGAQGFVKSLDRALSTMKLTRPDLQ